MYHVFFPKTYHKDYLINRTKTNFFGFLGFLLETNKNKDIGKILSL
jgi:hypothetical protein